MPSSYRLIRTALRHAGLCKSLACGVLAFIVLSYGILFNALVAN